MLKKLLTLVLCAALTAGLAACGGNENPTNNDTGTNSAAETSTNSATDTTTDASTDVSTNTETDSETDTATDTDASTQTSANTSANTSTDASDTATDTSTNASSEEEDTEATPEGDVFVKKEFYDPESFHRFFAADTYGHSIVLFDLALSRSKSFSDLDSCIVWEWSSDNDPNCKTKPGAGIDSAKIRYSPYYGKDVLLTTSSSGWAGVVDYEARSLIWEWSYEGGNFHDIEMMPNGDVVVAGSGTNGQIFYIPLSAGMTTPSSQLSAPSGHGAMYDPQNDWLWYLDFDEIFAVKVENAGTTNATISRVAGKTVTFPEGEEDGHALSPILGEPGKYAVSNSSAAYVFDSKTMTLTRLPDHYNGKNIKGMAFFADQTAAIMLADEGSYFSQIIRIVRIMKQQDGTTNIKTDDCENIARMFYKVFPATKNYQ